MKKCLSVFMMALLIFTGCEDKANDKLNDLKSEENQNQINDDNTETDIKQTITDENGNKIEINIPANNIENKNENSNISDDLNNNTDKNDKTDDSDDKEINVKPITTGNCPNNYEPISGNPRLCSREWVTDAQKTYNCLSGYILTSDYKCKLK